MPRVSVFIPTHDRHFTLPYAVRSVQAQGVADIEILICGDGVTGAVRETVRSLQADDARIRFFDLPKGPVRGEVNRDYVTRQAKGRHIFHQNDDDLWLPGHIEMLEQALEGADFVGAIQVNVDPGDKVRAWFFDLERPEFFEPWLEWTPNDFGAWACNGFGPVFAAHSLDAYLRLPEGWTTTPVGLPTDQFMWIKFIKQPWCRARFLRWPVALHFGAPDRRDWNPEQRVEELRRWSAILEAPDYAVRIWRDLLPDLGDRLLRQALDDKRTRQAAIAAHAAFVARLEAEHAAAHGAVLTRLEAALAERDVARAERDAALEQRLTEYGKRLAAEKDLNDVVSSTSWRLTGPIRKALHRLRRQ